MHQNLSGHVRNDAWLENNWLLAFEQHSVETVKSIQRYKLNRQWVTEWLKLLFWRTYSRKCVKHFFVVLCISTNLTSNQSFRNRNKRRRPAGYAFTNTTTNFFPILAYDCFCLVHLDCALFWQKMTVQQICHHCCWIMFTVSICDVDRNLQHEQ